MSADPLAKSVATTDINLIKQAMEIWGKNYFLIVKHNSWKGVTTDYTNRGHNWK